MSDVKWIKIATDLFDDEKIILIESLPDSYAIIVVWIKLLCLAGKMNNSGVFLINDSLPYTEKMLATIFRMKESTVSLALQTFEQFGIIEKVDGVITIPNWGKHQSLEKLEARKKYQREYHREYRKRQKLLAEGSKDALDDESKSLRKCLRKDDVNTLDKNKSKKENNIYNEQKKSEIDDFYEEIWRLYPNKRGKGQVSNTQKRLLFDIGIEELTRAIERYKKDLQKEGWRKPQYGSTFFNSGYEDYLDANYEPPPNLKIDENMDDLDFY